MFPTDHYLCDTSKIRLLVALHQGLVDDVPPMSDPQHIVQYIYIYIYRHILGPMVSTSVTDNICIKNLMFEQFAVKKIISPEVAWYPFLIMQPLPSPGFDVHPHQGQTLAMPVRLW